MDLLKEREPGGQGRDNRKWTWMRESERSGCVWDKDLYEGRITKVYDYFGGTVTYIDVACSV